MTSSPSVEAQTNDEKLSRRYRLTRRLSKPKKRVRTSQRATGVICALETACTHIRVRAAEPLVTDRPPELLTPLPGRVPRAWMDPGVGIGRSQMFFERLSSTYSTPGSGFDAYLCFFRERSTGEQRDLTRLGALLVSADGPWRSRSSPPHLRSGVAPETFLV
jgi:hypothetical protein